MMLWSIAALALTQGAQALESETGGAHSLDFANLGHGPWVANDGASWVWTNPSLSQMNENTAARKMLGRRNLLECSGEWGQCAGVNWTGPTCCAAGTTCVLQDEWYSQCKPSGTNTDTTTTDTTTDTTTMEDSGTTPSTPPDTALTTVVEQQDQPLNIQTSPNLGGGSYKGDATYYSDGTIGACSMDVRPDGYRTVAVNSKQWDNGAMCGTCVEGYYTETSGTVNFKAIIDNLCPECAHGDLDFRQNAGGPGDGRWPLEWKIIPCPSSGPLTVKQEGGNQYYSKIKIEGGPSPVTALNCDGREGKKTSDAFFEFQDNSGTFCKGAECTVSFTNGAPQSLSVSGQQLGGFC